MTDNNRNKLLLKLRALVAVIKVALEKIERAKDEHGADSDRLNKVETNLVNTLSICNRAIQTIQDLPNLGKKGTAIPSGVREYTEMGTVDEYRKFQAMEPIQLEDVARTDIDELIEKLLP